MTTFLDTLVDFGLNAVVVRDMARRSVSPRAAFHAVNALRLALWLVGLPIVALVYGPLRDVANLSGDAALASWVFYMAMLPTVLAKTATGVLWAAERLDLTAGVSVLATLLRTGIGAIVLLGGLGLVGLASARSLQASSPRSSCCGSPRDTRWRPRTSNITRPQPGYTKPGRCS